jgi:YrbI family 3-deoxy-D-manno-octulosonate 8-phosphate phosphatase
MPLDWKKVCAVVFDFDGVLTDNRVWVFEDGREAVCCNRADGLAFDEFRARKLPAVILSTEKNPVVAARAKKLQVPAIQGSSDKAESLRQLCAAEKWDPARVLYVGNDLNDLGAMTLSGFSVATADAHPHIRSVAKYVLQTAGGAGVAREIARLLFAHEPGYAPA